MTNATLWRGVFKDPAQEPPIHVELRAPSEYIAQSRLEDWQRRNHPQWEFLAVERRPTS
jgi:hypothetical protein